MKNVILKLVGNGQRPSLGLMGFLWIIYCKQANCIWKVKIWTNIHHLCLISDQLARNSMCPCHPLFVWSALSRRWLYDVRLTATNQSVARDLRQAANARTARTAADRASSPRQNDKKTEWRWIFMSAWAWYSQRLSESKTPFSLEQDNFAKFG